MANIDAYKLVALDDGNIHLLRGLYQKVFGKNYNLEQIRAKYKPEYTDIVAQGHFAFYKGEAIAFHGAIPMYMTQGGNRELCAQYGDAMTLKSHTGNGLFTKLGELTDELLIQKGVKFVWGFPNQNSEYGYVNKLHWSGEERMQCFKIKLRSISKEQIFRRHQKLQKNYQIQLYKRLSPYRVKKSNLNSIDLLQYGGIERSDDFYKYKSFTPNYFLSIKGNKVWIKPKGGLLIGDMEIKSEQSVLQCIQELISLGKSIGLHQLVIQASPKSQICQILKKHHTPIDTWLIGYKNFDSNLDLERLQFTYGDLDTF